LSRRRDSLPLWAAYARMEARAGQAKVARRILDTALASLPSMPAACARRAPFIALAYAEMELGRGRWVQDLPPPLFFLPTVQNDPRHFLGFQDRCLIVAAERPLFRV
jgi:hypothetical protein